MGAILTCQTVFHNAGFGRSVDQYSPVFQKTVQNLKFVIQKSTGITLSQSLTRAKILIVKTVVMQSFVQAICDDFYIAAFATIICIFPLLLLRAKKGKKEKVENLE